MQLSGIILDDGYGVTIDKPISLPVVSNFDRNEVIGTATLANGVKKGQIIGNINLYRDKSYLDDFNADLYPRTLSISNSSGNVKIESVSVSIKGQPRAITFTKVMP